MQAELSSSINDSMVESRGSSNRRIVVFSVSFVFVLFLFFFKLYSRVSLTEADCSRDLLYTVLYVLRLRIVGLSRQSFEREHRGMTVRVRPVGYDTESSMSSRYAAARHTDALGKSPTRIATRAEPHRT